MSSKCELIPHYSFCISSSFCLPEIIAASYSKSHIICILAPTAVHLSCIWLELRLGALWTHLIKCHQLSLFGETLDKSVVGAGNRRSRSTAFFQWTRLRLSLSPLSCRPVGKPVPLPHHGRPGAVHGHRAQLQHGRLLRRPLYQHHGLVLQRRTCTNTHVNPSDRFVVLCPRVCLQLTERVLQKAAERRHLQVQVKQQ